LDSRLTFDISASGSDIFFVGGDIFVSIAVIGDNLIFLYFVNGGKYPYFGLYPNFLVIQCRIG